MIIASLAFFGGALTILSPCILPVLPFVFARTDRSFLRNTAPLLVGMAMTFAALGTLAAVGGAWAVRVNNYGRYISMILLALTGLALLSETLADRMTRPIVALGNRLVLARRPADNGGVLGSLVLGIAIGFLWAPCAGPILGLILTGAAINGPSTQTTVLLFAYAAGAILSLTLATVVGGQVLAAMRHSLGIGEWIRRGLGAAVLLSIAAIALGWDTGALTRLSLASTNRIEQSLMDRIHPTGTAGENLAATAVASEKATANPGGAMTGTMKGGGAMMSGNAHP